uniref:Transcriptional regulator ATRX-like n=1 Tax=Nicotiana tabacum TaxID=4097 RepID=A0A1S4CA34_TOBAC|nr:PREDICTED: transcriptional regulator ATRX-like [Nicotiana tabacum]
MSNLQDNPETPPHVSPNTNSSSIPTSESPKPRFRKTKLIARKAVASGPLRKALNERLKASQRKESSAKETYSSSESDQYISASEGDEPGSSHNVTPQENPKDVKSCFVPVDVVEKVESRYVLIRAAKDVSGSDSVKLRKNKRKEVLAICGSGEVGVSQLGGSRSGEAAEGLVDLSKQPVEPSPFVEETLADMMKKVGGSYDPKKRKASSLRTPSASKPTKKSKHASPKATPRVRTTRSKVRESEAELKRALEESKRKRKEKGKGKVGENSEAVAEEEDEVMELVHPEKHTTEEAPIANSKETRTSAKKPSKPVPVESSLAKRTRSASKGKQVKMVEEEEESDEEEKEDESENEQDRYANNVKRKILKGRLVKDLEEPGKIRLLTALGAQGWKDIVLQIEGKLSRKELVEFMANGIVKNGVVTSTVKGVKVKFNTAKLGKILDIPCEGYDDCTRQRWPCFDGLPSELQITRNFCDTKTDEEVPEARAVQKSEMRSKHKVLVEFVNKCLLPRQERRHTTNYMDLVLMQCMNEGKQINWHVFIVKLLERVMNGSKAHAIPYGFILTIVLERLDVPFKRWEMASSKEHFGIKILQACDYLPSTSPSKAQCQNC